MLFSPKFSIIIPSCNEGIWLEKTVRGVLENTNYPDFEIIVIADACTDNSTDFLKKKKIPNVKLIETSSIFGAMKTRNMGAKEAEGTLLVFIDSHEIPQKENWLSSLAKELQNEKVGAVSLKIPHLEEKDRIGYIYTIENWALEPTWIVPNNLNSVQQTPAIPGGCFGIQKKVFEKLDGFDEGLKLWGREDFEFSLRIWRAGYDLVFSPKSAIAHSYDRKRNFEISYQEVDYNTIRTALLLFSEKYVQKVFAAIKKTRPESLSSIIDAVKKSPDFYQRKNNLDRQSIRSFEEYIETFSKFLPKN
ncbi:glycosyltransferase [Candidatus Gracilibacteria bacterium]|nr:glycosyltransferase [Candidatus Gracilibacteria bacterium]